MTLSPAVRKFLEHGDVGTLSTVRRDGRVRQTLVYYVLDGDRILVSTEAKRGKSRDIARGGWASFCKASRILGENLSSLPDGETGARSSWIGWQYGFLAESPLLEPDPEAAPRNTSGQPEVQQSVVPLRLVPGRDPALCTSTRSATRTTRSRPTRSSIASASKAWCRGPARGWRRVRLDGLAEILARFLQRLALRVRAPQPLHEGDVALGHLLVTNTFGSVPMIRNAPAALPTTLRFIGARLPRRLRGGERPLSASAFRARVERAVAALGERVLRCDFVAVPGSPHVGYEERALLADCERALASPAPREIVGVWPIAVSAFQGGEGRCRRSSRRPFAPPRSATARRAWRVAGRAAVPARGMRRRRRLARRRGPGP